MTTTTITKRVVNGEIAYYKRVDDFEMGYFGKKITEEQYNEERKNEELPYLWKTEFERSHKSNLIPSIIERITYLNK